MHKVRANSSPDLVPPPLNIYHQHDDSALEGVAANVKLLLKLIQDHKEACIKENHDRPRMLRVATMMTLLDNVKIRIQKSQSSGNKRRSEAELRRCSSDLRISHIPRDKKNGTDPSDDSEKERLKKELHSSFAAQKSLGAMCSSLGKEKEIMSIELSVKVHQLSEMEDLVNDLKEQNDKLLERVRECVSEHKERKGSVGKTELHENSALQERNKELSQQLLRSLDGYRSMKRRVKEAEEENMAMHATMRQMGGKLSASLDKVRSFKDCVLSSSCLMDDVPVDVREEIVGLEGMFNFFQTMIVKHDQERVDFGKVKGGMHACNTSVLA